MARESKLRQQQVDEAVVLNAGYQIGSTEDRRRIDEQVLSLQRAVIESGLTYGPASYHTAEQAFAAGDIVCAGSGAEGVILADTGGINAAGVVIGMVMAQTPSGSRVLVRSAGAIPPGISGLAIGVQGPVRLSASGRAERVSSFSEGDIPLGYVNAAGTLVLAAASMTIASGASATTVWKDPVRVVATSLPAYTRIGNTITANANGALPSVDGVALVDSDRVLVAIGTSPDNGLYALTQGTTGTPWSLARTADASSSAQMVDGVRVPVREGTDNHDSIWDLATNDPIVLNTTALTFINSGAAVATISLGAAPALTGEVRLSNAGTITSRNGTNDGDLTLMATDASNNLTVGSAAVSATAIEGSVRVDFYKSATLLGTLGAASGDFIAMGTTVASAGNLRLSKTGSIKGMNSTSLLDRNMLSMDGSDVLNVGDSGNSRANIYGGALLVLNASGGNVATFAASAGDYVALGATPAAAGHLRLSSTGAISARNSGGSGDLNIASYDGGDALVLGDNNASVAQIRAGATNGVQILSGATLMAQFAKNSALYFYPDGSTIGLRVRASDLLTQAPLIQWAEATANPNLQQVARTSDAAVSDLTLTPQAPFNTATGTNRNPGSVVVSLAAPTNSGTAEGSLKITRGGTFIGSIGPYPTAPSSYSAIWLGPGLVPGLGNYVFACNGSNATYLNAPSGAVYLTIGGTTSSGLYVDATNVNITTPTTLRWSEGVASPNITQVPRSSDVATTTLTVAAQSAWTSATGANRNGGDLYLQGGFPATGGTSGKVGIYCGNVQAAVFSEDTTYRYFALGNPIILTNKGTDEMLFSAQGGVRFYYGATTYAQIQNTFWATSVPLLQFSELAGAITIRQDARTTDAAVADLTLQPQAPFATATGTNRNPGNLKVALAAPTNGGAAEASLQVWRGGAMTFATGAYPTVPASYSCIWLGPSLTPATGSSCVLFADGSANTYLNVASGTIGLAIGGGSQFTFTTTLATITPPTLAWVETAGAVTIKQAQRTTDTAPTDFTIAAQCAKSGAATNKNGAHIWYVAGLGDGDGTPGTHIWDGGLNGFEVTWMQLGASRNISATGYKALSPALPIILSNATSAYLIGIADPSSDVAPNNLSIIGQCAKPGATTNKNGADVYIAGGASAAGGLSGGVQLADGGGNCIVRVGPSKLGFFNGGPATKQTVTGSRGGNAALQSLLSACATYGLITDSTSA